MLLFDDAIDIDSVLISDAARDLAISTATVRNWIKTGLLESSNRGCVSRKSLDSLKKNLEQGDRLSSRANKSKKGEQNYSEVSASIQNKLESNPFNEAIVSEYERALSESYRNKEGIYYTSSSIVTDMLRDSLVDETTTFLDPCCGCGNFIMGAIERGVRVENIYGFDTDKTAIRIAKQRIYAKTGREAKNIVCADFLTIAQELHQSFDLIYTNPPWGKKMSREQKGALAAYYRSGKSTDSCSLFVFAAMKLLAKNGSMGFLLPESVLNIATFQALREFFLSQSIQEIKNYGTPFESIQTKAYSVIVRKSSPSKNHQVRCIDRGEYLRLQTSFLENPKQIFNVWVAPDEQTVIDKLFQIPHSLLEDNADWALGVVTGDNKSKCKKEPAEGLVPIYRGKDISSSGLSAPSIYIDRELSNCQQVAPLSLYYAEEKIIYRFISDRLVFYCDTSKSLVLNSANILVLRKSFSLTSQQLTSLLNSKIINWLFAKVFNTHKILRADLEALPLYTSWYSKAGFDEELFLEQNNIEYSNGTFRIKG